MGLRLDVLYAIQAQNEEIGSKGVACLRDLVAGDAEPDEELRRDFRWDVWQHEFLKLLLASNFGLLPHLDQIASGGPMKAHWYGGCGKNLEHNEVGAEVTRE